MSTSYVNDEDEAPSNYEEIVKAERQKRKPGKPGKAKVALKVHKKANGKAKLKKQAKPAKKRTARNVDLSKLDQFGFRLNSKKHKAAVMYASKKGATLNEVKKVLKSTQFNLLTELEERGFKIKRAVVAGANGRNVTRFHILP